MNKANAFRKALLEAIDSGLQVLGKSVRDVVYYYIEQSKSLRYEEIPERLEDFHRFLEGLFGSGARVIEKLIANKLYSQLGLSFEERENWTLVAYVANAKKAKARRWTREKELD